MNLEQLGEELKQARLAKEVSLMDISAETRINLKFLEAIERGKFHIMPQVYIRAFLREYASIVGLDPNEIMERYNSIRSDALSQKSVESASRHKPIQEKENLENRLFSLSPLQRTLTVGMFIVAIIVIVIMLANSNRSSDSDKPVTEVPFDRVVRESEAASVPPPSVSVDSTPMLIALPKDSLRLEIATLDSVWINLLIDGKKAEQHLFGPNKTRMWVAKERFIVTMGNAGGATFQLNGKNIGQLGKLGAVVRNAVITEATLEK